MKRLLFGVFAHPDDEAFGPSGTLLKRVRDGEELHLICVTKGQAGMNPDNVPNLGEVRDHEWRAAGRRIGAASMHNLGYQDGTLSNRYFHEIADKIDGLVRETLKKHGKPAEISFITLDTNGLTGHLDHIAVSYVTTYLYYRLKTETLTGVTITGLDYFCLSRSQIPRPDIGFTFTPAGRDKSFITKTVDVSDVLDEKIAIMREHRSQREDFDSHMSAGKDLLAYENFHTIGD